MGSRNIGHQKGAQMNQLQKEFNSILSSIDDKKEKKKMQTVFKNASAQIERYKSKDMIEAAVELEQALIEYIHKHEYKKQINAIKRRLGFKIITPS